MPKKKGEPLEIEHVYEPDEEAMLRALLIILDADPYDSTTIEEDEEGTNAAPA